MTDFQVAMIWRPHRSLSTTFQRVHAWWVSQGVTPLLVDAPGEVWSAAAARNQAMLEHGSLGEPLVIVDADVRPQNLSSIHSAVQAAYDRPRLVHLPFSEVQARTLGGNLVDRDVDAQAGCYVTTPEAWWSIGGQDERFLGRSTEKQAFALAHHALLKEPMPRLRASLWAYRHPRTPVSLEVDPDLMARYLRAEGNAHKMRPLVKKGHRAALADVGETPVKKTQHPPAQRHESQSPPMGDHLTEPVPASPAPKSLMRRLLSGVRDGQIRQ